MYYHLGIVVCHKYRTSATPNSWVATKKLILAINKSNPELHIMPKQHIQHMLTHAIHMHGPTRKRNLYRPL